MYGCIEKVVILGVIPYMSRGSLILVTLSSSSIPQIPIHIYIKKIKEIHIDIYKKVRTRLDSKYDVLNENS